MFTADISSLFSDSFDDIAKVFRQFIGLSPCVGPDLDADGEPLLCHQKLDIVFTMCQLTTLIDR